MIISEDIQYIHIPKMGGTYFKEVIQTLNIPHTGDVFNHDNSVIDPRIRIYVSGIRPLDHWMISYFWHRQRNGFNWQLHRKLDSLCKAETVDDFFTNLLSFPDIVSEHFEYFLQSWNRQKPIYFLKVSNLSSEVSDFFKLQNISFDMEKFSQIPKIHKGENIQFPQLELRIKLNQSNPHFWNKYGKYLSSY